jgi:hypothetical protein
MNKIFFSLIRMGTDLTRSEIDMIWSSSGFHMDRSIPFPNLIRQIIIFNREDNQLMLNNLCIFIEKYLKIWKSLFLFCLVQRSQSLHDRQNRTARSTISTSTRALSSSGRISEISSVSPSIDYHEVYERILPYVREFCKKFWRRILSF